MMPSLNILICGGGCAGPALAFWLVRGGHRVTIIERYPALRDSGAQIDIRAQGIELVKRMGLLEILRLHCVHEIGSALVDADNHVLAAIPANTSGKGAQSITSQYEIMRGDFVRILYNATKDQVQYVFGKTIESFDQDNEGVTVHLSDGTSGRYDILIGADGQGSRTRTAITPPEAPDPLRRFGVYLAYWTVPRMQHDDSWAKMYHIPGSRGVMCRSHCSTETQAILNLFDPSEELHDIPRAPIEEQKQFWAQRFQGAGGQTDRLLAGMKDTESFYCHEMVQVHTETWFKNRVVLVADAAHCPSPLTGMGTTSALVGSYVLAGEICRNSQNISLAFENYDRTLRPFVNEIQAVNPRLIRFFLPRTHRGIALLRRTASLACSLRLPELVNKFSSEKKGGWTLPEYSELLG